MFEMGTNNSLESSEYCLWYAQFENFHICSSSKMNEGKSTRYSESLKDFQNELDQRNALALKELNKQIDELAKKPIDQLPPYLDSIEYISPPLGIHDELSLFQKDQSDLSWALNQDFSDFKKLSTQKEEQQLGRYSTNDTNSILGAGLSSYIIAAGETTGAREKSPLPTISRPLSGLYIPDSFLTYNSERDYDQDEHLLSILKNDVDELSPSAPPAHTFVRDIPKEQSPKSQKFAQFDYPELESPEKSYGDYSNVPNSDFRNSLKSQEMKDSTSKEEKTGEAKSNLNETFAEYLKYRYSEEKQSPEALVAPNTVDAKEFRTSYVHPTDKSTDPVAQTYKLIKKLGDKERLYGDLESDFEPKLSKSEKKTEQPSVSPQASLHSAKYVGHPFINDDMLKETYDWNPIPDQYQPRLSAGKDNSKAIINALKTLQDRVGKLEGEKSAAQDKIESLEKELSSTKKLLFLQQEQHDRNVFSKSQPAATSETDYSTFKPRTSVQGIEKTGEKTLEDIAQARQKVNDLKERVDRVKNLGLSSGLTELEDKYRISPRLSSFKPSEDLNIDEKIEKHLRETVESIKAKQATDTEARNSEFQHQLDSLNHKFDLISTDSHKDNDLKIRNGLAESPAVASPLKTTDLDHSTSEFAKEADKVAAEFAKEAKRSGTKESIERKQAELKKLKQEIEIEKSARAEYERTPKLQVPDASQLKEKILEKLKLNTALKDRKQHLEQSSAQPGPTWKKVERKGKHTFRDHTVSSSAHVRKRGPLEVPSIVGDETGAREMPFIVGKNIGKSFSVTANLQKVFSMLKSHNPDLCSVCSKRAPTLSTRHREPSSHKPVHVLDSPELPTTKAKRKSHSEGAAPTKSKSAEVLGIPTTDQELKDEISSTREDSLLHVLGILEQEFKESKSQYNSLVKQYETIAESMTEKTISESSGSKTLKAIGDDLRLIIQNMETKSDQITILRDIIANSMARAPKKQVEKPKKKAPKRYTMDTITSKTKKENSLRRQADPVWAVSRNRARSHSPGRAMASLSLLKSSFKVQDTLGLSEI
ncbi:hypothetical protein HDV01_003005 [Terramyces sp. JEL0728]|nr:hypothetical protein HDV01_003005 [Terramyces sp. JEL0728]